MALKPSAGGSAPHRGRLIYAHYAWVIVAIIAVMQMVGTSIRMAFGVFIEPLEQTFAWSQGSITLAYAISSVVTALASPFAGWFGDRFGARRAMTVGTLMFLVGMLLTGVINSIWELYLYFGVLLGRGAGDIPGAAHTRGDALVSAAPGHGNGHHNGVVGARAGDSGAHSEPADRAAWPGRTHSWFWAQRPPR